MRDFRRRRRRRAYTGHLRIIEHVFRCARK